MQTNPYHVIKTPADARTFQDEANGLHDGFITHVEYNNSGITARDHYLSFDHQRTSLVIHVLVTSMIGHPTFEIQFRNLLEWQINDYQMSDMIAFTIQFLDNGLLLWANDCSPHISDLKKGCYVIAESIQYRRL